MKPFEKYFSIAMLLFAVLFNLWLYRLEPTAFIDPNDNLFQYALVYRTNQIIDFADKTCSGNFLSRASCTLFLLVDHWVPNWNEGFNLPFYYSHVPQIVIAATWRMVASVIPLFTYYHWVIYLLLCLFPLSMFFGIRIAGFSWLTAGFAAILASHLSTDGLFGLDPPSFLWRGYGLSSQLFAMIWLPLAIGFAYSKRVVPAILFLVFTTAGHLGIGIMAFLSLIPLLYRSPKTLLAITVPSVLVLSYWIVPAYLADSYHNYSFWDPVWKFNSYGVKEIIAMLFNGDLFDFGRLPIFTFLIFIGIFALLTAINNELVLLFFFWLFLYFGRTTWGPLIDLVPAMREFHLSRFIVGVHIAGLFLAPIGLSWLATHFKKYWFVLLILLIPIYKQTIVYNGLNDTLIKKSNGNFQKQSPDMDKLVTTLMDLQKTKPGRVFAGRGGSWGKDFVLAETNMTMYLGNYALSTVLWLPETWSPNGDTEQYFREDKKEDYDLYNIRYIATPPNLPKASIQPFWKQIAENPLWKLYEVETTGYFTVGTSPAIVAADKYSRTNVVRLWIQSDDPKNGLYPRLTFDTKKFPVNNGLPNFKMTDEVTYVVPDGTSHNVFAQTPKYLPAGRQVLATIEHQSVDTDIIFKANVSVPVNCTECFVILKQSYHPNWRVLVDGAKVEPIITFPFYVGIPVPAGSHQIVASYESSHLKKILLTLTFLVGGLTTAVFLLKLKV